MGVQGLKTYIENSNKDYLSTWAFRDKQLIIDGCNLFHTLYFDCHMDQFHGGDYDAFEELITQFFRNLAACDIRPYVVLDGGDDHTDKKWETLMTRKQRKIKAAYDLSVGKKRKVLPVLAKITFTQVLHKLKVPLVQCLEEADWEIAALAKEWNCPVLSDDSDFYIFNLRAGFLPITHFQWKRVKSHKRTNKKIILAKHFTVGKFCASFEMNIDILPVFACILGNDYVKLQNLKDLDWEEYSSADTENPRIDGLLNWLSQFPKPEAAVSALVELTRGKAKKAAVKEALFEGIKEYKLISGYLSQFFLSKTIPHNVGKGPLQVLPKWTLRPLLEAKMGSCIIDILVHQRVSFAAQVENFQLPCSSTTSLPIRQVIYGLLLLGDQPVVDRQGLAADTRKRYVKEYKRQELILSNEDVEAIQTEVMKGLHLKTLSEAPHSSRLQVLLDALGGSSEMLKEIPRPLQLQMLVTRFWLMNAQPQPCQEHLWALLIGMVFGQLSSPKARSDMLSKLKVEADGRRPVLEEDTAHVFSQWQSCLKMTFSLNRLLSAPLPEPECAWLYRGSLVHQVVRELRRGVTRQSLLDKGSSAKQLFKQLKEAIVSLMGDGFIKTLRAGPRDAGKTQRQPIDDLSSQFEHLMCEDSDSEDDDDLSGKKKRSKDQKMEMMDRSFPIRSRHKAKARNGQHPSKKYERRCFE